MNENVRISINISLKFVPKGLINNIPALVQIMAWRRPGDKPLSEPMMVSLLTHIYALLGLNELSAKCEIGELIIHNLIYYLFHAQQLREQVLMYCELDTQEQMWIRYNNIYTGNCCLDNTSKYININS